jgi:antitoxin component YwqK of YwqJK toxin-antitoxin module
MRNILIILSLCLTLSAFGQTYPDSGFTNKAEAKNLMKHGKKEGKWMEYCNNDGEVTTNYSYYYSLRIYRAGKPYGLVRVYDNDNGKLYRELPYDVHGKENGVEKQYYESGKIEYERPYVNGKRNGMVKKYYESGKLEMENQYADDKIIGSVKFYYESGKLKSEVKYTDDIEGETKNYDETGKEIK